MIIVSNITFWQSLSDSMKQCIVVVVFGIVEIIDKWCIYHTNIRNFETKRISLKAVLNSYQFSLVTMNETHLRGNKKVKLPGFVTYTRNWNDKASGGISTSVSDKDAPNCVRVEEGMLDNEFIVTRHSELWMDSHNTIKTM